MINKPMRNHWIYLINSIISLVKNMFVIFIMLLATKYKFYYIGGILVLGLIFSVLEWRKTLFYINDDLLVYEKGILSKSKEEIPFNKINTIDVGQNIIDRIFKVCTVKIDTGSVKSVKSEVKIIVKCDIAEELRAMLLSSKKEDINIEEEVRDNESEVIREKVITNKEIFKYAITKGKLGWAIGGFFVLRNKIDDIAGFFDISISKYIGKYFNTDMIMAQSIATSVVMLFALALMIYILITIFSIIFEVIRLYKFTIKVDSEKINISYGLLSKKQYSFSIDKIYGIRFKQSILQQLIKTYTVELITIGYGDEKNESGILYPIGDEKFKNEVIRELFPNLDFKGEMNKPPKSSLRRFIVKNIIVMAMILIIPIFILLKFVNVKFIVIGCLAMLALLIIHGALNYKNTALGVSRDVIIASSGGFSKGTTIISQENVQSITKKQNIFQKRARVCSYKVDIYSNKLSDIVEVNYMKESLYNTLNENMIL